MPTFTQSRLHTAVFCATTCIALIPVAHAADSTVSDSNDITLPSTVVGAVKQSSIQTTELPSYKLTAPLIDTPRSIR